MTKKNLVIPPHIIGPGDLRGLPENLLRVYFGQTAGTKKKRSKTKKRSKKTVAKVEG